MNSFFNLLLNRTKKALAVEQSVVSLQQPHLLPLLAKVGFIPIAKLKKGNIDLFNCNDSISLIIYFSTKTISNLFFFYFFFLYFFFIKKDKEADAAVSMLTLQCNIANNNNNAVDLLQDEEKWVYWEWHFI